MIFWNPDEVALTLGPLTFRWYAVCWCIGLALAYLLAQWLYKKQNIPQEKFEPLFFYVFVGTLLGARLGHCLFYEPGYFLSHPIEMFLPIRQDAAGGWHFTGYAGLASHGGTIGIIIALWLYVRRTGVNIMRVVDTMGLVVPVTACAIRIGNLMNSEIVGKFTGSYYGFVFLQNNEQLPRHPAQLYEAIAYFVFLWIGLWLFRRYPKRMGTGFFFGFCLTSIFTFRFFIEFLKDVQEQWELEMVSAIGLNQGQLLSIPFIIIGLYALLGGKWCKKLGETQKA